MIDQVGIEEFELTAPSQPAPDPLEFFPTTDDAAEAFLLAEAGKLRAASGLVWECAAGEGHLSRWLRRYGFAVVETDIEDRGIGAQLLDFTTAETRQAPAIVTNPPFSIAELFIEQALGVLDAEYLALLLPTGWWNAGGRFTLFERYPPAVCYPMTWKMDFLNLGSPRMNCQWCVWRDGPTAYGDTRYVPLRKRAPLFEEIE